MSHPKTKAFAQQFDPQPFHLYEAAAKSTFFGELVASAWHTAAITMRSRAQGAEPESKLSWFSPKGTNLECGDLSPLFVRLEYSATDEKR